MVMSEVSLRRVEELLLGAALELRPALAVGNPVVLSVDWGHPLSAAGLSAYRKCGAPLLLVAVAPGGHGEKNVLNTPLAIRFHNVAGTCARW